MGARAVRSAGMDVRSRLHLLLVALLLVSGCSTPGTGPADSAERVAAVRDARQALAAPAEQLGTAVVEVQRALEEFEDDPGAGVVDELASALADLSSAATTLDDVELAPSTAEVRAAVDAVDQATAAATRLGDAGQVLVTVGRRMAATDARLQELTATWDQRGSRSEVLARLEETATTAEELVVEDPQEGCPGPVEQRSAAAGFVAEASRSLQPYVAAYDGEGYDARRAELHEAPYGHAADGEPRQLEGPEASSCPALEQARSAADEVEAALQGLEDALNPTDLAS